MRALFALMVLAGLSGSSLAGQTGDTCFEAKEAGRPIPAYCNGPKPLPAVPAGAIVSRPLPPPGQ